MMITMKTAMMLIMTMMINFRLPPFSKIMCHQHDVSIPNNSVLDRIYCFFFLFFKLLLCEQVYTDMIILGQCCWPFLQIDYLGKLWVYLLSMSVEILCAVFGMLWFQWEHDNWFMEHYLRQVIQKKSCWEEEVYFLIWMLFFVDIWFPHMHVSTQWSFG